jgi:hypothetical protein
MRNREMILRQLERIDNSMKKMKFYLNRGESVDNYKKEIELVENMISEVKSMIEREDMNANEINPIR